jgi:ankyrin repeat protein
MTSILLLKGANPNVANMSNVMPLSIARRMGFTKITTLLLRCGAMKSSSDESPAYKKLQSEIVENAAEVQPRNHTQGLFGSFSSTKATKTDYTEVLDDEAKELVQSAMETLDMILPDAAYLGLEESLAPILRRENIEDQDEEGSSLLMKAAYRGHHDLVRYLVKLDCDTDAIDKFGNTAMVWAVIGGHLQSVKILHDHGGNLNGAAAFCKTNGIFLKGQLTPLIAAAYLGNNSIIQYLLKEQCDANLRCGPGKGKSAIAVAAWARKKDTVTLLLSHKAYVDPNVENWLTPGIIKLKKLEQEKNTWIGSNSFKKEVALSSSNGSVTHAFHTRRTSLQDKLVYFTSEDNMIASEIKALLLTRAGVPLSRLSETPTKNKALDRTSTQKKRNTGYRQGLNLDVN